MTEPAREVRTHCCYYNTDCGAGEAWLRAADIKPAQYGPDYYSSTELDRVGISIRTADEEDGEPRERFSFEMMAVNVTDKLSNQKFNVDLTAYLTKDELKRLHAVFGLLLGISAP